jgi:predicted O-linked N-acetylglucosamine transferase (SPINDLY family)
VTVAEAIEIAAGHHRAGRLAEAEAIYRQVLAEYPDVPEALNLFGALLHQYGRNEEAVMHLQRAIAARPDAAEYHNHLAVALGALGDTAAAIAAGEHAIALAPGLAQPHYNLAVWLSSQGRMDEALHSAREAVRLQRDFPAAHNSLGCILASMERVEEAIAAYDEAIRLRPDYAKAHYNRANMLAKRDQDADAVIGYRNALRLQPDFPDALFNLGNSLYRLQSLDAAADTFTTLLRLHPTHAGALWHLGNVWQARGRIAEAIAHWRRGLEIESDDAALHSALVLYLQFDPAATPDDVAEEKAAWNAKFAVPLRSRRSQHPRGGDPEKRLRIGYVSPDLRDHVVGRNILPLFSHHDRTRFEILCYSDVKSTDAHTKRLRATCDAWRDSTRMSDEALAARVREDEVDILVDLSLHTGGNRLLAFARQPAPVQFSFAGYPGSTGVETIAHRISDPRLEGGGEILPTTHLIDSFWCFDPIELEIAVNPLPAADCGRVTFACLNQASKVNDPVLALWARVLQRCEDSRLLLLSPAGSHQVLVRETLRGCGIAPERIQFVPPAPREEFMRLYHRVDVMLDSFPYGGHTTSLEALWMGVPVVTLPGDTLVSRAGVSQLSNLGMPELIARDAEDFVRIATSLAGDLTRLAEIRRTLRPKMERSVLMDATRFARGIENAYRTAWRQWCEDAVR